MQLKFGLNCERGKLAECSLSPCSYLLKVKATQKFVPKEAGLLKILNSPFT